MSSLLELLEMLSVFIFFDDMQNILYYTGWVYATDYNDIASYAYLMLFW